MDKGFDQQNKNNIIENVNDESIASSLIKNDNEPISSNTKTSSFNMANIKNYFGYALIGGVVLAAIVAIISIFVGEFNSYMLKAIGTIVSITIHVLLILFFLSLKSSTPPIWKSFFVNIALAITIASFFTSFLSTWEIIALVDTTNLYQTYWWGLVSSAFIALLIRINTSGDKNTGIVVKTTIGLVAIQYTYSLFWIFSDTPSLLGDLYWKFFATFSILLGTSSILVVVFRKIYVSKHPELFTTAQESTDTKHSHIIRNILIVIAIIYLLPYIISLISDLSR